MSEWKSDFIFLVDVVKKQNEQLKILHEMILKLQETIKEFESGE